jgi:ectoine hydroxylase
LTAPNYLTQKQREQYFEDGFILLERIIPECWVERLKAVTDLMIEESRRVTMRDAKWDIEPGHTYERPRLRRLSSPTDHHPV